MQPRWNALALPAALAFVLAGCAATAASDMTVSYKVSGAVAEENTLSHSGDATHFCSTAEAPWSHARFGRQDVEIPQGPPRYEFHFDDEAAPPAPSVLLSLFGYTPGMTAHSDPADDRIALNAGGKHWIGHGTQAVPAFAVSFTIAPDGQSGTFTASGLHRADTLLSGETIAVSGSWQCPAADTGAAQ